MLESLLYPKTVAVIGASRTPGKVGHEIVANLKISGFAGEILPINPSAEKVLGLRCYPDLKTTEHTIDLSVIAVPAAVAIEAVDMSINAGVKAVIVITAGFKEIGQTGAEIEKHIAEMCRSRNVRMLGPNCLGLINTEHKMNASFAKHMPRAGGISVISQSGALCTAILDWAASRGIGLAKLISIGNKADLSETDFIEVLAEDKQTKVIACYIESIEAGKEFLKTAEAAASVKPVVVLKVGTTQAGAKAASSHTGSLAGGDIAYGAAFRRSGVIRVDTFEQIFDCATALSMQPIPKGNRVAIVTNAGGPGIMAADAAESSELTVTALTEETAASLKSRLPAAASVANPIDILGDADAARYAEALKATLSDASVDAVIVILTPQAMTNPLEAAKAIVSSVHGDKPVLAVFMGGLDVQAARDALVAAGVPDYPAPERAVAALRAMCDYGAWRRRPPRIVTRFPVNRRRVERILARYVRSQRKEVAEVDSKAILEAYDFQIPMGRLAASPDEAAEVATRIGFPVAMKIASPDIIHKSDLGGVRLSLLSRDQVRDSFDLMMLRIGRRAPDAKLDGVYVERMCPKAREVILGMSRDPQFGPMLMFGLGGIFVEVMKDVTFHLAPITADEAMQMLMSTRSYGLLKGARGQRAVDMPALAAGLQKISQLATDFPQILELDINPFLVGEIGTEPVVADARMTLLIEDSIHKE